MGQACTNPLQYLIDEYGDDVGKFIVVEKSKRYFDQKYPQVKEQLNQQTKKFESQILAKVENQSSECTSKIKSSINQLKEGKKQQIAKFEQTSKKSVDEFIGIDKLESKFSQLKEKSKSKLDGMQKTILTQADSLADKQRGVIQSQRPSLPIYDKLPQCLKDKVWEQGEKKFGEKIQQEKQKQQNLLKQNLNFDELKKKYGADLPTDEITNISSGAQDKLNQVKKMVNLSGNLDNASKKLGDAVGNFKNLF